MLPIGSSTGVTRSLVTMLWSAAYAAGVMPSTSALVAAANRPAVKVVLMVLTPLPQDCDRNDRGAGLGLPPVVRRDVDLLARARRPAVDADRLAGLVGHRLA